MNRILSIKLIIVFCLFVICKLTAVEVTTGSGDRLKWKVKIGEPNEKKNEATLSAAGDLKFEVDAGFVWRSSPAIGNDGTIYVGSTDDNLYAVNPDGSVKWKYQAQLDIDSSPAIANDGTIYVGSDDGCLYALNQDGSLKWKFQIEGIFVYISSSPAIAEDGSIYFGSWDNYIYALKKDGTLKWKYDTQRSIYYSSPAIGNDGTIYIGGGQDFFAINPDGTLKWIYNTGSSWLYNIYSPAIGNDGTIYFGSDDYYLYAVNPDGTHKWKYKTDFNVKSSPVIGNDGAVYFGSDDNHLYALNPDGSLKWKFQADDDVSSSPVIGSDGTIYVGSEDYNLYALNPDGTLKWSYYDVGITHYSSPTISNIGIIISAGFYLYAIDSGTSSGLADSPWPKFSHDLHNTGRFGAVVDTGSGGPVTPEFSVTLTCGSVSSSPGSTIEIPISLNNNEVAIGGGQFVITPSPSNYVSFKGVSTTNRTNGWTISYNASGNGHIILFYSGSGATIAQGSGNIMTISYEISSSAPTGTEINLTLSDAQISDNNQQSVAVTLQNGKITVGGCILPGDVTGDGLVNIFDVLTIVKFALGQQSPTSQEFACADMNEDGSINIFDVLACVNKALGKTLQLAGYRELDLSQIDFVQLNRDLRFLGADQSLINDVSELVSLIGYKYEMPKSFSLSQNSPNPFNPSTSISYSIPDGKVVSISLKVYDIRGRFVRTFEEGLREGGTYHVFWDGTDESGHRLSSGIYIYRMQAGDFVQTRKMVLIK